MRLKRRDSIRTVDINMTPLIDLFLNILVFFIVATTFATDTVFFVDLPEASPGIGMAERKLISIAVSPKGAIAMDNKAVTLDELRSNLAGIPMDRRGTMPVVVRADQAATHGTVVSVIDVIRQMGLRNVGIATRSTGSEK